MVFQNGWFTTMTFVLLCPSGVPCGPCSECKFYLVVLTICRPTIKQNVRTTPSSKLHALIDKGIDDWVEAIPLVELCVNNAMVDSTVVSPAAFTYG